MNKHMIINGRVQGVGFRYTAKLKAEEYQLAGWVRNKIDGTVELEVEGNEEQIDSFVNELRSGLNNFIRVDNIEETISESEKEYNKFFIK